MQEGRIGKLEYLSCHYTTAWEFKYEYKPKTINPNKFHVHTVSILTDRETATLIQFVLFHTRVLKCRLPASAYA
jgi:hypothetical protein